MTCTTESDADLDILFVSASSGPEHPTASGIRQRDQILTEAIEQDMLGIRAGNAYKV